MVAQVNSRSDFFFFCGKLVYHAYAVCNPSHSNCKHSCVCRTGVVQTLRVKSYAVSVLAYICQLHLLIPVD